MERLLILDGNSLMNRAFYALPPLTNSEGIHTNAVYGFTNMLLKMKEELNPDYVVTTFDRKAPTFRHVQYGEYKAGRKKMPPELAEQFPVVKELLDKLSINIFEIDGFEADDLIGTLSVFAEEKGIEVYIITGDRDALQLATDNVKVVINKKGMTEKEIYDRKRMMEEFGVTPQQFIDVKGLMGDKSDNIPGVPGVGEKTAYKLIQEYGTLENVLQNIDKVNGKKIKENLMEYSEQAVFSKKLATIMTNVPVEIDLDSIKSNENYDAEGVRNLFHRLQFKSLIDKVQFPEEEVKRQEIEVDYEIIESADKLSGLKTNLDNNIFLLFDIESENIYSASLISRIYLNSKGKDYVINLSEIIESNKEEAEFALKQIFGDESIGKIIHDAKNVYAVLGKMGIEIKGLKFDTKIAAYLIDPSKSEYNLVDMIGEGLNIDIKDEGMLLKVKMVHLLNGVYNYLDEKIKSLGMDNLLFTIEQPLIEVLASMESRGFKVDTNILNELGEKFSSEISSVQNEIYNMAGEEFNISSPKQLGKILFEKLDLPVIKKTKTGYSTNAEVLEKLADKHPIIDKITYYRQLTKLYSTYIEGLKAVIDKDGKIHSSFNQTVTTTGRLSSTEPNLQNIPIKYEMGRAIRKVFVPDNDDCILLSADYSQIELRVLAHIAGDENMIDAFKHHSDIHTITASEVFKVPIEEVTSRMRSNAKAVNFGIVYGIGEFSLAEDLKISRKEAKSYIDAYLDRYPNIKKYLDDVIKKAEEDMNVITIMGRRRIIPEIKSSNKIVKALGQRLAMNSPIQGSAADIIKLAMVNVYKRLNTENFKSTLILQVHDELILNVYKDELDRVKELVKKEMEDVLNLKVPLEVDVNIGATWYEAK